MTTIREYKVGPRNSTVNGELGRMYDWSLFCWDGSAAYRDACGYAGHPVEEYKAPLPWVDGGRPGWVDYQYLHVPYNYAEVGTIYRVRPNDSMQPGQRYRGRVVSALKAVQHADGWYWQLHFQEAQP